MVVRGASANNLRHINVALSPGLTAIAGVSGSGKSSLAFDVVLHEGRRRLFQALAPESDAARLPPAAVDSIEGLLPAIGVAQDTVIRNPHSSVATATGLHPFLRLLYARYAERRCPKCSALIRISSAEDRFAFALSLLKDHKRVDVCVPLAVGVRVVDRSALESVAAVFGLEHLEVDGERWSTGPLNPDRPHSVALHHSLRYAQSRSSVRELLRDADRLGSGNVRFQADRSTWHFARSPVCECGARFEVLAPADFRAWNPWVKYYMVASHDLVQLLTKSVRDVRGVLGEVRLPGRAARLRAEIDRRLGAIDAVGLGYLALDRPSPTLSRGEAQRLQISRVLTNRVDDLLHVLDEPSIGLDVPQTRELMRTLSHLRGPVVMVEHDRASVGAADRVIELGPGASHRGGRVVFEGTPAELWRAKTRTGKALSATARRPRERPRPIRGLVAVRHARANNLAGFDCSFPVQALTVITGPSGAGKSTLARDVVLASTKARSPVGCTRFEAQGLRGVLVDQLPIGRNPRSNPATFVGLADLIRSRFADATGQPASVFSFNRSEGWCPSCSGMGAIEVKLPHLPSEWTRCDRCDGKRFIAESLLPEIRGAHRRLNIADTLELTVDQAISEFANDLALLGPLQAMSQMGLGYLVLGQSSTTLSGGEAQRLKLSKYLSRAQPDSLVVLDEPTTGLHSDELSRIMTVLRELIARGSTVLAVEHHPGFILAADWIIRLGPGGGPRGGQLLYCGPARGARIRVPPTRPRATSRSAQPGQARIEVRGAVANNLRNVSVDLTKGKFVAIVGRSGSGKSSLLHDVIGAEARRRMLECLSSYERQALHEGPEAPVQQLRGLGPTIELSARPSVDRRVTVGEATGISAHIASLLAYGGTLQCQACGSVGPTAARACPACGEARGPFEPKHFSPRTYEAACLRCGGIGTTPVPQPERLIVSPSSPLCAGAMYSPGFFPTGYLCRRGSGGFGIMRALGKRYGFDAWKTPWQEMSQDSRDAFLFGQSEPMEVQFETRTRSRRRTVQWLGFFGIVAGWDVGGLYVGRETCSTCEGRRLRPEYLRVRLAGLDRHDWHSSEIARVHDELQRLNGDELAPLGLLSARDTALRSLGMLRRLGLGHLQPDRLCASLSAGEIQRTRLAALLAADLHGMTVLLDEPSRGLHPSEVATVAEVLAELRDAKNTVLVTDHDPEIVRRADEIVVLGPNAGTGGGRIVAHGALKSVSRDCPDLIKPLLSHHRVKSLPPRPPARWLTVLHPTEHNLTGEDVRIPLGVLVGICGVSGSGKSTLAVQTLGRALAPARITTSVAYSPIRPGAHDGITGAPTRAVVVDQTSTGVVSPSAYLDVGPVLRRLYSETDAAVEEGLGPTQLIAGCDRCGGKGVIQEDMGFLPSVVYPCEACDGTGYSIEARNLRLRGLSIPELEMKTIDDVATLWRDEDAVYGPLSRALGLGLGYLVLRQPGRALSGGELQRLKLARELGRSRAQDTLYIVDEPTVGLHALDVEPILRGFNRLVEGGSSIVVVEHNPQVLAQCDWLLEFGRGPRGNGVIAEGPPAFVASKQTATAPYLRRALGS